MKRPFTITFSPLSRVDWNVRMRLRSRRTVRLVRPRSVFTPMTTSFGFDSIKKSATLTLMRLVGLFMVSRATYTQAVARLKELGFPNSGEVDRGFMYSIYFRDPLGQLLELACYKFEPPHGATHADVLREAHNIRVAKGAYNIADEHLADAIELLSRKPEPNMGKGPQKGGV